MKIQWCQESWGQNQGHFWSQWEAIQESTMQIVSVSGTASERSHKKTFSFFTPGSIGPLAPELAITLKYQVPTDTFQWKKVAVLWNKSPWLPLYGQDREEWLQREKGFSLRLFLTRRWSFRSLLGVYLCSCSHCTWKGTTIQQKTQLPSFTMVLHLLVLGPAVSWAVAGGVLAGSQLQTPEPQVTVLEFHVSGLTSTFFFPASAGK